MITGKKRVAILSLIAIAGWIIWLFVFDTTTPHLPSVSGSPDIRLNQEGFYTHGPKIAIVKNAPGGKFFVRKQPEGQVVFTDTLTEARRWEFSGEVVRKADFSALAEPGNYYLDIPMVGISYAFRITSAVNSGLQKAVLRSFYYQRASTPIELPYAGEWPRKAGHRDDQVKIHVSAASASRPEGTRVSSSRGWYDAGDYGKYVPTATFSTWMLLDLYGQYPAYYDTLSLNIPESSNSLPDILDESLWSIRWLLTMQDPVEGFVCHKLTTTLHARKVMPKEDQNTRLMIGKSTAATLSFAAVMARASGTFRKWEPSLADSCLKAAQAAWVWGRKNPSVGFENPEDIETGPCRDDNFEDERAWAAAELWAITGEDSFYRAGNFVKKNYEDAPSRRNTGPLAWMTLLEHSEKLPAGEGKILLQKLSAIADRYRDHALNVSAYGVPLGERENDFVWGGNGNLASRGVVLMFMARKTGEKSYANAATSALDYIMGRNATGYCFVTGFGTQPPQNIHHRISLADGIVSPIPGLMVGGPQNELNRDECMYPDSLPATKYLDDFCSYTTNEVTINWNAPLAWLTGAVEQWYGTFEENTPRK
ncbi:MAG: glycoside hydrolase family 9 protein [Bacteroidia bacterium]|nr:glycoside hydrolase family 9 protein [Bacteroidia bacterium]